MAACRLSIPAKPVIPESIVGVILYQGTSPNTAEQSASARYFVDGLVSGSSMSETNPVLVLRNRLLRNKIARHTKMPRITMRAIAVLAWNKLLRGEECKLLKWSNIGPAAR